MIQLNLPPITVNQVWDIQLDKYAFQKKVLDTWNDTAKLTKNGKPMDGFISPLAPFAAVVHNQYDRVSYTTWVSSSYGCLMSQINVVDYPSCVVPVTYADKNIDKKDTSYTPINELDRLVWNKCAQLYEFF